MGCTIVQYRLLYDAYDAHLYSNLRLCQILFSCSYFTPYTYCRYRAFGPPTPPTWGPYPSNPSSPDEASIVPTSLVHTISPHLQLFSGYPKPPHVQYIKSTPDYCAARTPSSCTAQLPSGIPSTSSHPRPRLPPVFISSVVYIQYTHANGRVVNVHSTSHTVCAFCRAEQNYSLFRCISLSRSATRRTSPLSLTLRLAASRPPLAQCYC